MNTGFSVGGLQKKKKKPNPFMKCPILQMAICIYLFIFLG